MPRRTKYTDELAASIAKALWSGASRKDAYEAHGIGHETFRVWLEQKPAFLAIITRAEAECAQRMAETLTIAALTDWRAGESWLKRRRREDWGDRQEVAHSGSIGFVPIREVAVERPKEPEPDGD